MLKRVLQTIGRIPLGLMSKEHSVGTGLLLGLAVWTLTRLVDNVTQAGTIEYQSRYRTVSLANGQTTSELEVRLTNLSRDVSVKNLEISIYDPHDKITFDATPPGRCAFGVPAWAKDAKCAPNVNGMAFMAPMLIPGTSVAVATRYTGPIVGDGRPIFRIRADADSQVRLIAPGWETWVAGHESQLLIGTLAVTLVLLLISIGIGVAKEPKT